MVLPDFDLVSASIVFEVDKLRIVWCPLSVVASVNGIHMVLTCMVLLSIVGVIML